MKYTDVIYFTDDVAKAYAEKRKNLSEKEAKDLIRCLVGFLKQDIKEMNEYAYQLPRLGTIYKSINHEKKDKTVGTENKRLYQQMFDIMFSPSNNFNRRDDAVDNTEFEV